MTTLGVGTNQIQTFGLAAGANVETPDNWNSDTIRQQGFQIGIANPTQANTLLRQVSFIAATIAQFSADFSGAPCNDDGNVLNAEQNFINALQEAVAVAGVYYIADTGTANAMIGTCANAPTAYTAPCLTVVKKISAANTGAMTVNFWGLGAVALTDETGAALSSGALLGNSYYILIYSGGSFHVLGGGISYTSVSNLTANSGDMIQVVSGTGVVNLRIGTGVHSATVGSGDMWPRANASDDTSRYMTTAEFLAWLNSQLSAAVPGAHKNLLIVNNPSTPTSLLNGSADGVTLGSAIGATFVVTSFTGTLSKAISGAGGIDTGSIAGNATYDIYFGYNPTTTTKTMWATLEGNAPTVPSGYTYYQRMGWTRTDSAGNFYNIRQVNDEWVYCLQSSGNTMAFPVIASGPVGSEGNWGSWTPASVSLSGVVPAKSIATDFYLYTSSGSANACSLSPNSNWVPYMTLATTGQPPGHGRVLLEQAVTVFVAMQAGSSYIGVIGGKINI